jgi:hypothetical protein
LLQSQLTLQLATDQCLSWLLWLAVRRLLLVHCAHALMMCGLLLLQVWPLAP